MRISLAGRLDGPRATAFVALAWVLATSAFGQNPARFIADVRDYGAVDGGRTLCTEALQKAIDACAGRGGGTVRLPSGNWLTGTVYLASDLTLELERGCTLLGSRSHEDYAQPPAGSSSVDRANTFRYPAILAGIGLKNVTIRGEGMIDGQGDNFRDKEKARPKNIYLERCRNVTVEGIRLRNAGSWMQHFRHCDGLVIRKIDVFNHATFNNDGLNVDSCRNVLIEECRIDSDDDGIVLKSLSLDPCRDVTIRDCVVSSHCNAIKMGTESGGGFAQISVRDCTIHSPQRSTKIYGAQRGLAGIALEIVDGGVLENVTVEGIRIDGVTAPIFLRLGDRGRRYGGLSSKPEVGTFRNVVLRNITAENASEIGCSIAGLPGHPIEDVVLENLKLGFDGGGARELASRAIPEKPESYPESTMFGVLPAYGLYGRHVNGLTLRNVVLRTRNADFRHALVFDDVKRLAIDSLRVDCASGAAAPLRLTEVEEAVIRRCQAPPNADPFILLEGKGTRQVVLQDNDLSRAVHPFALDPEVSPQALTAQSAEGTLAPQRKGTK